MRNSAEQSRSTGLVVAPRGSGGGPGRGSGRPGEGEERGYSETEGDTHNKASFIQRFF